ncbi:Chromo (CHRromatin Organization MOdifier) domain [Carpediemonas membranifera]|uniref:Chromo (CHRromatin Organization MOdifier) domain n=1 Tax=Carpediemonas membranifera TaxID=201153 RepID=A0A8J6E189_9EUKA|nr:Chromo (CHRromatin Organization MOdifier) domain [Carpediemonas membranifera]|eukprot:KAG9392771.1 Chromo (CHRromatin Organization MOdifier) domain [Carpediemonas membranifera]
MPFGLRNAPIHCQKAMEHILGQSLYTQCLAYIDDIVVFGANRDEFLKNLEDVLARIHAAGLKLNPSKTVIGATSIDYLGWRVDKDGKRISPDRLEAIHDLKEPTSLTDARALLGFANYFRALIERYVDMTEPITELTRAAEKFVWGDRQHDAFEQIKRELLLQRTLVHPCPDEHLHIFTDASDYGIGGVLMNAEFKPIAFFAKTLTPQQRRWSTIEKECYALYFGTTKFRRYLAGRDFTAHLDHRNLVYMDRSLNSKVIRWSLALSEYSFDIVHVPGSDNSVADTLSRLVHLDETSVEPSPPPEAHRESFQEAHGGDAGHLGRDATCKRIIAADKGWPGMRRDVTAWIRQCPVCQLTRLKLSPFPQATHPMTGSRPFEVVEADTIGPLSLPGQHRYAVVIIDTFTRLTQAYPHEEHGRCICTFGFIDMDETLWLPDMFDYRWWLTVP